MKSLSIHYFQHVPFEGLGSIEEWINKKGHKLSKTGFYENYKLPDLNAIDWLIVMGGPMGVYDEHLYPWMKEEKQFIRAAIEAGKVVLGICLGAQLIAEVLGVKVYPNKEKEIGWFRIQLTSEGSSDQLFSFLPKELTVFHWHGDTFDLPIGSKHIFKTNACSNQAYVYKDKVVGLQFHLEVTAASVKEMLHHGASELKPAPFIQTAEEISKGASLTDETNGYLDELLNRLALLQF